MLIAAAGGQAVPPKQAEPTESGWPVKSMAQSIFGAINYDKTGASKARIDQADIAAARLSYWQQQKMKGLLFLAGKQSLTLGQLEGFLNRAYAGGDKFVTLSEAQKFEDDIHDQSEKFGWEWVPDVATTIEALTPYFDANGDGIIKRNDAPRAVGLLKALGKRQMTVRQFGQWITSFDTIDNRTFKPGADDRIGWREYARMEKLVNPHMPDGYEFP
jgi:hypothetical protein